MPKRAAVWPLALAIMLAVMLGPPPAPALAATQVSYPELLREIRSGPLIRAVINPARGDIEIKFRNLSEWEAFYPAGARPSLQRRLHARHIRVIFASRHRARAAPARTVHHHLRYIAAAVLGALLLLGAGALVYRRRRSAPAVAR
jgi:hypothetical protein